MTQKNYISSLLRKNPKAIIVGSLGSISKDLDEILHGGKVLVRGAMGHAMAVGLGIALHTDKKVIVLIGDGSFLMSAGTIATINRYAPKNFSVIVLDNGKYASTGGQETNFKYYGDIHSRWIKTQVVT